MIAIDSSTIALVEGLVFMTTGVTFILTTVMGRANAVGRVWSAAFALGILSVICFAVTGFSTDSLRMINAIGCAALAAALCVLWSGCRVANQHRPLSWVAAIAGAFAGSVVYFDDASLGTWAGSLPFFSLIAVLTALSAVESVRGRLLRDINASALTIVFALAAVYYAVRACIVAIFGTQSSIFLVWFGTSTTGLVIIVLILVAGISMTALRNTLPEGAIDVPAGDSGIPGVATLGLFEHQLHDWLRQGRILRIPLMIMLLDVDDLAHLNRVFGHEFGDIAIRAVGRSACENAPLGSIVGRLSSRRFAVLSTAPSHVDPRKVAEQLQNALVESPIDTVTGIRAVATIGVATTAAIGYQPAGLLAAAARALDAARAAGSGEIMLDRAAQPAE
ncbi:diguanylate cyclase [Frigoribacterium sp. UYMn621]|uniref:GGDEF domain-containing protein n=1 Tax=Frigoribacterium sp. UYMn621 TaxID=3156343 RepID=UPI003391534A